MSRGRFVLPLVVPPPFLPFAHLPRLRKYVRFLRHFSVFLPFLTFQGYEGALGYWGTFQSPYLSATKVRKVLETVFTLPRWPRHHVSATMGNPKPKKVVSWKTKECKTFKALRKASRLKMERLRRRHAEFQRAHEKAKRAAGKRRLAKAISNFAVSRSKRRVRSARRVAAVLRLQKAELSYGQFHMAALRRANVQYKLLRENRTL